MLTAILVYWENAVYKISLEVYQRLIGKPKKPYKPS